ncbi:MAG: dihydrofolate reductase [Bacteroidaceae bacterium]|nr:dihydrofolate reductase [Bacteroidaceae bacterium]
MKSILHIMTLSICMAATAAGASAQTKADTFQYNDERFADLQMLRYKVEGFESLTLRQKTFIYYLQEAALTGRDILFDQNGRYNLRIRHALERIYTDWLGDRQSSDFQALSVYLKRVWFSNGIHHHYGCEKFVPGFSESFFREAARSVGVAPTLIDEICPVMFDPSLMQKRVNLAEGQDLVLTSASNYYRGVTQQEAEDFYQAMKDPADPHLVMFGMNSRLVKDADGVVREHRWTTTGLYHQALARIVNLLRLARPYAEDADQQAVIDKLVEFYTTGDLHTFDEYTILWAANTAPLIDFVNGFTECYGDPLGLKCSWESIVNFKDLDATRRTETLSQNAQWFEDHSPVDPRFRKEQVKGISAKVITAAILGGDLYPSTAIGINLPNSDWVRREHGSKSVTIGNLTDAYNKAARGSGFLEEFAIDPSTVALVRQYGDLTDDLHTDLHECLGHGSGRLLPGVDPDSLKAYGSTIEEARADLFGLYYVADPKLVELGLTPDADAYKAQYYTYMMNGLMTQLVRIQPGNNIEEAHMRNRALIAHWCYEQGRADNVVEMVRRDGKTYVQINDYAALRRLFGRLLAEIQRVKSEGDYLGAQALVEQYGVRVDPVLHREVLDRYQRLDLAPYKGFINPVYTAVRDQQGHITDVTVRYDEAYDAQMLRYSRDYETLPLVND